MIRSRLAGACAPAVLIALACSSSSTKKTDASAVARPEPALDAAAPDVAVDVTPPRPDAPADMAAADAAPDVAADAAAPDAARDVAPDVGADSRPDAPTVDAPFIAMAPSPGCFTFTEALGDVTFGSGKSFPLEVAPGSSAFHPASARATTFYAITDRGPTFDCLGTDMSLGQAQLCGAGHDDDKIFPLPAFTPTIFQFELAAAGGRLIGRVVEKIALKDKNGKAINGLTNDLKAATTERGFDTTGKQLAFDPSGVDTEALVRLDDGTFWIAEEYGPSLLHAGTDGRVLERIVPSGVDADLAAAAYPVKGGLPAILARRKLNRGIESLGLGPDGKTLYFAVQSPLANPDEAAYLSSRHLRVLKASLKPDGSFDKVEAEYLYVTETTDKYGDPVTMKGDLPKGDAGAPLDQSNVKVSELVAVGADDLVLLERITKTTKLYRVKLAGATNLLGTSWDMPATAPSLEQLAAPPAGVTPVSKRLVFDSLTATAPVGCTIPAKIESVAVLDATHLLLANDSDFGVAGDRTTYVVLPLAKEVAGP